MVERAALGRTVLLSSHQISEVERVADWVAILHQGQLQVIESLAVLRQTTQLLTATMDDAAATLPLPPGQVLTESRSGRQVRWVVRDLPDDWRTYQDSATGVTSLRAQQATLEDIFVAVCDTRAHRLQPPTEFELESITEHGHR
jgi:ABC-2 type transport system ATP-binding protein